VNREDKLTGLVMAQSNMFDQLKNALHPINPPSICLISNNEKSNHNLGKNSLKLTGLADDDASQTLELL
jgi:hypothetical protein